MSKRELIVALLVEGELDEPVRLVNTTSLEDEDFEPSDIAVDIDSVTDDNIDGTTYLNFCTDTSSL